MIQDTGITRRTLLKAGGLISLSLPLTGGLLFACSSGGIGSSTDSSTDVDALDDFPEAGTRELTGQYSEAVFGGSLRIALIDEPPTLDIHQTTAANTAFVGWHIFEAVFTWDAELRPMPELPEQYSVSADGLVHRFRLRPDVRFHDGALLRSADVVASIQRWGSLVGLGASLLHALDEFVIDDDRNFEIRLFEPFGTLPVALARQNQGCAIYPEWAIEEAGEGPLENLVGTGPYRFIEHLPDRHIRLERFEVFNPAPGEVDGYGGQKHRFLDELLFIAVSDEAARVNGLQAGEFHFLESISADHLSALDESPDVIWELSDACCFPNLVINLKSPLMVNPHLRRALQLALDHEPVLQAGYGDGFFQLEPSLLTHGTPWHTHSGSEYYNVNDVERAGFLLQEAEYDNTPVRFMVTQAYRDLYNSSMVIAQQLEDLGFAVNLQVFDWATMVERRDQPEVWDLYLTLATFRPDPIMRNLTCDAPGWWRDEQKDELLRLLQSESDFNRRFEIWEEIQRLYYEQVPRIKFGDTFPVIARSDEIRGFPELTQLQPAFWNSWLRR